MLSLSLLFFGVFILIVAWMPMLVRRAPLSLAIVCVGLGCALLPLLPSLSFLPIMGNGSTDQSRAAGFLAQATLVLALMGAGLKIDRPFSLLGWQTTWRLLGIAMPLTIGIMMVLCIYVGGFATPEALLIAAALAPTDPVLASSVSVGPPLRGEEGEARFALTSESALNDGLASPVVHLAIALTATSFADSWLNWILVDWLYRIGGGLACGLLIGRMSGFLTFKLPVAPFSNTGNGLIAVGLTMATYAISNLIHVNGFIAVFVMAVALRSTCPRHEFHRDMDEFASQIERLIAMILLFFFGGALAEGLLAPLGWREVAIGLLLLLLVRPLTGWLCLLGSGHPPLSRALTAFFGIRGVGTLYYMIYALQRGHFAATGKLWALVGFVVTCSLVLHGTTATPAMIIADRRRHEAEKRAGIAEPERA
jgi:NhaP-type Na+/H+ or K+/H+ antiporter